MTLRKIYSADPELIALQEEVDESTRAARKNPKNRGRTVRVTIPAASGQVRVKHLLDRKPQNFNIERVVSGTPDYKTVSIGRSVIVLEGQGSEAVADFFVY